MSTTAVVAVTRRIAGGATPSGGPGPVLPLAHGLAAEPAAFTAHTWRHAQEGCQRQQKPLFLPRPIRISAAFSFTPDEEGFS